MTSPLSPSSIPYPLESTESGFIPESFAESETFELIDRLFGGKPDLLVSALIGSGKIEPDQLKALRSLVKDLEED